MAPPEADGARAPVPAFLAAAVAWLVVVFWVGSRPADGLPGGGFLPIPHLDKLVHFGMYAMLAFLCRKAWSPPAPVAAVLAVVAAAALSDELRQLSVPGRSADAVDWVADMVGAASALAVAGWIARRRQT